MNLHIKHAELKKHLGIIGYRLSHTLSPVMHNLALKELQLPLIYGVMDVTEELLPSLISSLRSLHFRGANVTIPYKQIIMQYLDEISEEAEQIGAVNTIVNNNGRLIGHNTDAYGVFISLRQYEEEIKNSHVVIFGAGGATKATVYAIAKYFAPRRIIIVNRTEEKAKQIIDQFSQKFRLTKFFYMYNEEDIKREVEVASVIINTTSVGMKPMVNAMPLPPSAVIQKNHIVFDIVYNPIATMLLKIAKAAGARTINGVEMLLGQGARAFELWTHQTFPIDSARQTILQELSLTNANA